MYYLNLSSLYVKSDVFGIGNAVGSAISGAANIAATAATNAANIEMTESTNQTNKDIADATNQTNIQLAREANALTVSESEKAYQRSTASNQVAELVKTGISEQQARQIVAGSGSPAAYTPGSMQAAQTVAPVMQAPQLDASAMGNAAAQLGQGFAGIAGSIYDSFQDPEGGAIGLMSSFENVKSFSGLSSLVSPEGLSSWNTLYDMLVSFNPEDKRWVKSPSDAELAEMRDIVYKVQRKGVPSMRGFMSGIQKYSSMSGNEYILSNLRWTAKKTAAESAIASVQSNIAELTEDDVIQYTKDITALTHPDAQYARQLSQYYNDNPGILNQYVVAEFMQVVNQAIAQKDIWTDSKFRQDFVDTIKQNQEYLALATAALVTRHNTGKSIFGEPGQQNAMQKVMSGLGYVLGDMGIGNAIMNAAQMYLSHKAATGVHRSVVTNIRQ